MPPKEQVQYVPGLGDRLIQRLRTLELTQVALAQRADLSRQTLHRAIHQDEVTPRVIRKLAAVLGRDLLTEACAPALTVVQGSSGATTARAPRVKRTAQLTRDLSRRSGSDAADEERFSPTEDDARRVEAAGSDAVREHDDHHGHDDQQDLHAREAIEHRPHDDRDEHDEHDEEDAVASAAEHPLQISISEVQPGVLDAMIAQRSPAASVSRDEALGGGPIPRLTAFGAMLELIREDVGETQEEIASDTRISVATYRRIITGAAPVLDEWLRLVGRHLNSHSRVQRKTLQWASTITYGSPLMQALGAVMRAHRLAAGYDLIEVADACGMELIAVAAAEVGTDDTYATMLEMVHLVSATPHLLYESAWRQMPPNYTDPVFGRHDRRPAEAARVYSVDATLRWAKERQAARDKQHAADDWSPESGMQLSDARRAAGFDVESAAERLRRPTALLDLHEGGEVAPSWPDLERMATLYRTTPWAILYGSESDMAHAFPAATPSRTRIFVAALPATTRAWIYAFAGELAGCGLDDDEIDVVRQQIADPWNLGTLSDRPDELDIDHVHHEIAHRAAVAWRTLQDPTWQERPQDEWPPLPSLFAAYEERAARTRATWNDCAEGPSTGGDA